MMQIITLTDEDDANGTGPLHQQCESIPRIDDYIKKLAKGMTATARSLGNAAGLAAPQVGPLVRLIVVKLVDEKLKERFNRTWLPMVNPQIVCFGRKVYWRETCLSIPGFTRTMERSNEVRANYLDMLGRPQSFATSSHQAVILQHEVDHLDGILISDD